MESRDWIACFTSLERELSPLFGRRELEGLMRRAGRGCAERENMNPAALVGAIGLPIAEEDGGFRLTGESLPPGMADWCAGALEGADPERRRLRMDSGPDGVLHLRWDSEGGPADEVDDFSLAASGPLTPFQLAQVADLSVDCVMFVDTDLRLRSWNRGAEQMFGYSAEEVVGSYYDLLVPEDLRETRELETITRETEAQGTLRNYLTRRVTKDGREIMVSLSRTKIRNRHGQTVGFGVILQDVTDQVRMQAQLEAVRRLAQVGELASQVAHEVRNPLASIHGALQVLRKRLQPAQEEAEVFDEIAAEIGRLDGLVTDLLRFGRPTAPRTEPVDLATWIEGWVRHIEREPDERGGRLVLALQDRPRVLLDGGLFEQVLRNLYENSVEAAEGEVRMTLSLRQAGGMAQLTWEDDGPGIAVEIRERVLEPFFTTKARGSGLGLAVCRRHLTAMGGDVELLPADKGAAFLITLPLETPASP